LIDLTHGGKVNNTECDEKVINRLNSLSEFLDAIKLISNKYALFPSSFDSNETLNIGHRPWVGTENYIINIFQGVSKEEIEQYSKKMDIQIPKNYQSFLKECGGAFLFGISLYGIPFSMRGETPLLDRSIRQCHDLSIANRFWINQYVLTEKLFQFGGREYSYDENIGYFLDSNDKILSIRKNGEILSRWNDFNTFLSDEIAIAEKLEEEFEPNQWN